MDAHSQAIELVLETIRVLASSPPPDDDEAVAELTARGVSAIVAERLVALVPLAFGRSVISRVGVGELPSVCQAMAADGEWKAFPLDEDHLFTCALAVAEDAYATGRVPSEVFSAVATRSAEFAALNKALHAGSDPRDIVFGPPCLVRLTAEAWRSGAA